MGRVITLNKSPRNIFAFEANNMKEALLKVHYETLDNPECNGAVWVRGDGPVDMNALRKNFYEACGQEAGLGYKKFRLCRDNFDFLEIKADISDNNVQFYTKRSLRPGDYADFIKEHGGPTGEDGKIRRDIALEKMTRIDFDASFLPESSKNDLADLTFVSSKSELNYRYRVDESRIITGLCSLYNDLAGKDKQDHSLSYRPHYDIGVADPEEDVEILEGALFLGRGIRIVVPREHARTTVFETKNKVIASPFGPIQNAEHSLGKAWDVEYGDALFVFNNAWKEQATPHAGPESSAIMHALGKTRGLEMLEFPKHNKKVSEIEAELNSAPRVP